MLAELDRPPHVSKPLFSFEILTFKPHISGSLRGFAGVLIREMKLEIVEVTIHESRGKRWAGLPGKPMVDRDGRVLRDEHGEAKYSPVLKFHADLFRIAFSDRIVAALLERFPHAFDENGA